MAARNLPAEDIGPPHFEPGEETDADVFHFTSHRRAREALAFGLSIDEPGFHIFVLGENRSGRMTATLAYLREAVRDRPRPDDWVYLNNFRHPHQPRPYRLPAGAGRAFRDRMAALIPQIREALQTAFSEEDNQERLQEESNRLRAEIGRRIEGLRAEARQHGLDIAQLPQGMSVVRAQQEGEPTPEQIEVMEREGNRIAEELAELNRWAAREQLSMTERVNQMAREIADNAIADPINQISTDFAAYRGLNRWLIELHADILENLAFFQAQEEGRPRAPLATPEIRYAVNLIVDHGDDEHPGVEVEANPTYENLFGRMEYRQIGGVLNTDFTLIQAGALHRANGGILVLRAEALAAAPFSWQFLKGALRDGEIQMEELHRYGAVPIAGAPKPQPIPLDVKVVIVGAPHWYYTFFSVDPDFQSYFKIKADIDADMDASPENIGCYSGLIRRMTREHGGCTIDDAAISRLLGVASRWAADRTKLSSRFELLEDVLTEAIEVADCRKSGSVTEQAVITALTQRRHRNARIEDRVQEAIRRQTVLIDTKGAVTGQVNALTVRDLGDHSFGAPARVTARVSIGRLGVVNIEREAELGGPIQQKGAMVLQGYLAGHFARRIPLSFTCSITFEQSYGGVEGDSASLAEVIAVISDLAGLPVRQDLALTGSMNQRGEAQAIGGAHQKIEGFFRTCVEAGGLTGTQGAVIPRANEANLVLDDDVLEAVAAGKFHIYSVAHVDEALELFLGTPVGEPDREGNYPTDTVYGRALAQLESFDRIISARERH